MIQSIKAELYQNDWWFCAGNQQRAIAWNKKQAW